MIRITPELAEEGRLVLRVEGRLIGAALSALRELVERHRTSGEALAVDLGGVAFADHEALAFLRSERGRGTSLLNGTPYITYALED